MFAIDLQILFRGLYQRNGATLGSGIQLSVPDAASANSRLLNRVPANFGGGEGLVHGAGRSLLWAVGDDDEEGDKESYPANATASPICPMYLNQSESVRLDSQLRGWFQVDPTNGTASKRGGFGADNKGTSVGHFDKRGMRGGGGGLGGGIYRMLISEQGVRERLAEARRQP